MADPRFNEVTVKTNTWTIPLLLEKVNAMLAIVAKANEKEFPALRNPQVLDSHANHFIDRVGQVIFVEEKPNLPNFIKFNDVPYNRLLAQSKSYNSIVWKSQLYESSTVENCIDTQLNLLTNTAHYLVFIRNWLITTGRKFAEKLHQAYEQSFQTYGMDFPSELLDRLKDIDNLLDQFQFDCSPTIPPIAESYIEEIGIWAENVWKQIGSRLHKEAIDVITDRLAETPQELPAFGEQLSKKSIYSSLTDVKPKVAENKSHHSSEEHKHADHQMTLKQAQLAIQNYTGSHWLYLFSSYESLHVGMMIKNYFVGKSAKISHNDKAATTQLIHTKTEVKNTLKSLHLNADVKMTIMNKIDKEEKLTDAERYEIAQAYITQHPNRAFAKELDVALHDYKVSSLLSCLK